MKQRTLHVSWSMNLVLLSMMKFCILYYGAYRGQRTHPSCGIDLKVYLVGFSLGGILIRAAPWRNKWGPRPVRSFEHPDGLPALRWGERRKARLGNVLADLFLEVAEETLELHISFLLMELPEDLGTVRPRQRP